MSIITRDGTEYTPESLAERIQELVDEIGENDAPDDYVMERDIMAKAARIADIDDQMQALSEERAALIKVVETLAPETPHRGHGVRVLRSPVRTVDTKLAQETFPRASYPNFYQNKVAFDTATFKKVAAEAGHLEQFQTVSYRTKIERDSIAYADAEPGDDTDPDF